MEAIAQCLNLSREFLPNTERLSQVVAFVMHFSEQRLVRFIIDECQELDYIAPSFWAELQEIWDLRKNVSKFLLMMSGSIASAIRHIFGDISEPLFGRPDLMMTLRPFDTDTVKEIYRDMAAKVCAQDLLALYALTGGVARYLEWFRKFGHLPSRDFLTTFFLKAADGSDRKANLFWPMNSERIRRCTICFWKPWPMDRLSGMNFKTFRKCKSVLI